MSSQSKYQHGKLYQNQRWFMVHRPGQGSVGERKNPIRHVTLSNEKKKHHTDPSKISESTQDTRLRVKPTTT